MTTIEGTFQRDGVWWCRRPDGGVGRGRTPDEAEADAAAVAQLIQDRRQKQEPVRFERRRATPSDIAEGYGAGPAVVAKLRRQSKRASLIEAITSTVVGFVLSYTCQLIVFPLYGIHISHSQNLQIILIFTAISVVRGYWIRRLWDSEWWTKKRRAM